MLEMSGSASTAGGGKEKWERYKPHVNVGTIGHVGHKRSKYGATYNAIGNQWSKFQPPFGCVPNHITYGNTDISVRARSKIVQ